MNAKIKELAGSLRPTISTETLAQFLVKFFLLSTVTTLLVCLILPMRGNLSEKSHDFFFLLESLLWVSLSIISAIALYFRSFPETRDALLPSLVLVLLFTLVILTITQHTLGTSQFSTSFAEEMSLWKGRCGIIIMMITATQSFFMFRWAKKGASSSPKLSGTLASVSSAGLGCLLMQFVCAHEQSLHLLLWHFLPVFAVAMMGQKLGQKILRW